MSCLIVLHF